MLTGGLLTVRDVAVEAEAGRGGRVNSDEDGRMARRESGG